MSKPLATTAPLAVSPNARLCLTCASEPLPRSDEASSFLTPCCARPICARCVERNPRLARYNPCLACLTGVAATSSSAVQNHVGHDAKRPLNFDGGLRDSDVFVLGDEDEDDLPPAYDDSTAPPPPPPPPAAPEPPCAGLTNQTLAEGAPAPNMTLPPAEIAPASIANPPPPQAGKDSNPPPRRHHLRPTDTLTALALRYHVPARQLCLLNGLPLSTLSTTPALLHTRRSIKLPGGGDGGDSSEDDGPGKPQTEEERARAHARRREKAEKRLQLVAKEADWRVARAYVALAEDDEDGGGSLLDLKEAAGSAKRSALDPRLTGGSGGRQCWEARAAAAYLDDAEWEANAPSPRRDRLGSGWTVGAM